MHLTKGTTKGSCGEAAGLGTKKKPPDSDFFTSLKTHEYLLKIDGWDRKMIYVLLKKVSLRHVYFRGCISLLGNRSKKWRKWHFVGQQDRFVPFVNAAFVAFQSAIDYVCRRPVASDQSSESVGGWQKQDEHENNDVGNKWGKASAAFRSTICWQGSREAPIRKNPSFVIT